MTKKGTIPSLKCFLALNPILRSILPQQLPFFVNSKFIFSKFWHFLLFFEISTPHKKKIETCWAKTDGSFGFSTSKYFRKALPAQHFGAEAIFTLVNDIYLGDYDIYLGRYDIYPGKYYLVV